MSAIHLFPRVFASLDGGSTQDIVARRAVAIAAANNADLLFGHVVDSVPFEANGADFDALCESRKEQLEADLADILEEARKNPDIKSVDLQVRAGRITDTLTEQLIGSSSPTLSSAASAACPICSTPLSAASRSISSALSAATFMSSRRS